MEFKNKNAVLFIPDGQEEEKALSRTTVLCLAAHQDDIELMCYKGIVDCFGQNDKWFSGVVVADGAGSPRDGLYGDYTDEQMKTVRITEQKKAAFVGEYGSQFMLGYSSKQIKDPNNHDIVDELKKIILKTKPEIIYTHNLADKHDTHCGVVTKVIKALRELDKKDRPKQLIGCEVWRNLDWVNDDEKIVMNLSAHPNIANSLVGVFDSQICGGKRYDLAATGRRISNATYGASHGVDNADATGYAIDLTKLIEDDSISPLEYILGFVDRFRQDIVEHLISHEIKK